MVGTFHGGTRGRRRRGNRRAARGDSWWRDLLALTHDLGTYRGRDRIAAMLSDHLATGSFTNIRMVTEFGPRYQGDGEIVEGFLTFDTPIGFGRGPSGWSARTAAGSPGPC